MTTPAVWVLPLSLSVVLVVDQAVKGLALTGLAGGKSIEVGSLVRIRPRLARRVLAGRLGLGPVLLAFVWAAGLLAILVLGPAAGAFDSPAAHVALGAAFGGAAGNLLDLFRRRAVVDYVDLRFWPAFNVADVAIVAGVIVALLAR